MHGLASLCHETGNRGYSRLSHVVILKAGEIPLNRVAKTDYLHLRERAAAIVRELRVTAGQELGQPQRIK